MNELRYPLNPACMRIDRYILFKDHGDLTSYFSISHYLFNRLRGKNFDPPFILDGIVHAGTLFYKVHK